MDRMVILLSVPKTALIGDASPGCHVVGIFLLRWLSFGSHFLRFPTPPVWGYYNRDIWLAAWLETNEMEGCFCLLSEVRAACRCAPILYVPDPL